MLETILMILLFVWLFGVIIFSYIGTVAKFDGKTIIDMTIESMSEDIPSHPKQLALFISALMLIMVLGWPVTAFVILTKASKG